MISEIVMRVQFLILSTAVSIIHLSLENMDGRQTAIKFYVMLQQNVKLDAIKAKILQHRFCAQVTSKALPGTIAISV
jgi:hypothetical protein